MHVSLPHRHRRKLLFPPGLLALAGLLWLGCVALRPWQEQLKTRYMLQLTMPVRSLHKGPSIRFELPEPDEVCKLCSWQDIYFTGDNAADTREQIRVANAVRALMADSARSSGVRVHFASESNYAQLVFALNAVNREKVKKFWLDIHHIPTTLYAFNEPPDHSPIELTGCVLCHDVIAYVPPRTPFWVRFDDWVVNFWHAVLESEWRFSAWLFAAIALLSSWRMVRNSRNAALV